MNPRISKIAVVLAVCFVLMFAMSWRDYSKRNLRVFWGMLNQPAYQSQTKNPVLAGSVTLQAPVEHTVPRGIEPYTFENTPDGRQNSGWKLKNPYPRSEEVLKRGQEIFETYCVFCHGPRGLGDGPVAERAGLSMSLLNTGTRQRLDGGLFHIITYGRLFMPAHGPMIEPADRWKLIRYVRELQLTADLGSEF